jgi:hypothetical protein
MSSSKNWNFLLWNTAFLENGKIVLVAGAFTYQVIKRSTLEHLVCLFWFPLRVPILHQQQQQQQQQQHRLIRSEGRI